MEGGRRCRRSAGGRRRRTGCRITRSTSPTLGRRESRISPATLAAPSGSKKVLPWRFPSVTTVGQLRQPVSTAKTTAFPRYARPFMLCILRLHLVRRWGVDPAGGNGVFKSEGGGGWALFVWAFRCSVLGKRRRKEGKQMNLRRRLLCFHPPALRNAPKSSVWSSHFPPPIRTLRFHPPDRPATAKSNEALINKKFLGRSNPSKRYGSHVGHSMDDRTVHEI
ncbi:hypothetical protein KSP39_PZI010296 [Platanthera zijinensis]|uniref:Uncharacterized protein n=1 Tax=Platanthera zijinensis TaxID=2320716 RepID=A0AAP0BIL0_9ASPA